MGSRKTEYTPKTYVQWGPYQYLQRKLGHDMTTTAAGHAVSPTDKKLKDGCLNEIAFKRYRQVRFLFWGLFTSIFACLIIGIPGPVPLLFFGAIFTSTISIFMSCPFCGKTIGCRRWRIFQFGNALGGWCLHCKSRLFAIPSHKRNHDRA